MSFISILTALKVGENCTQPNDIIAIIDDVMLGTSNIYRKGEQDIKGK